MPQNIFAIDRSWRACLFLTVIVASAACASRSTRVAMGTSEDQTTVRLAPAAAHLEMEPIELTALPPTAEGERTIIDAPTLFEKGGRLLSANKFAEALEVYDLLLKNFRQENYVWPSLYNAGLAHEGLHQYDNAASRYAELIKKAGPSKEAIDAAFRLGGCYAELRRWRDSASIFAVLLTRNDLSISDRLEAMVREGFAYFRLGERDTSRVKLEAALRFYRTVETLERLDSDFFLAMANYYLAAIVHLEFRQLQLSMDTALAQTLDEKARLLLVAQAKYIAAINVRNPYWATAAGFQIGSLYREFYVVLMRAIPDFTKKASENAAKVKISEAEAKAQLEQVYREEVHKTVKPLLEKAIRVFEKNVLMAERTGAQSAWVIKSRQQIEDLQHLLTIAPAAAVEVVSKTQAAPEDQQLKLQDADEEASPTSPTSQPSPAPQFEEEPGRVVL